MTVKKYTTAIKFLRQQVKSLATEGTSIRQQVHALAWTDTPEAHEAFRKVGEARTAEGRRTLGKRFLKPYRRPETGWDRYQLWDKKRGVGSDARHAILAMGLLKERPYRLMEPKCHEENPPSCGAILWWIHQALGDNDVLKAEWTQERVVDLILLAAKKEAA